MRKLSFGLAMLAVAVWILAPPVFTQEDPWWRPLNPYGSSAGVTYGTTAPSLASTGQNPAPGEVWVDTDGASDGGAMIKIYNRVAAAWQSPGMQVGVSIIFEGATEDAFETTLQVVEPTADNVFTLVQDTGTLISSTLATNEQEVANSVWGIAGGFEFEGATENAFEVQILATDPTVGTASFYLPNQAAAAANYSLAYSTLLANGLGAANATYFGANTVVFEGATAGDTFQMTLQAEDPVAADRAWTLPDYDAAAAILGTTLATNAPDAANSWWGTAGGLLYEGATADAFELTIGGVDPVMDGTVNFNGNVSGQIVTQRAGAAGYYGGLGVPNPWRHNFIIDSVANCVGLLDDQSAVIGVVDTNVNNVVCATSSFEYWVEQALAGNAYDPITANADGWLIEFDDAANDGIQGMLFGADDDYDVGFNCNAQTDACYFEVNLSITDSSETDQVLFGWLVRENYSADAEEDGYDTYCLVGVDDAVADPRDIVISEEVNADGGANSDTAVNFVDGTNITLRVELDVTGNCDVYVNGALTNGDVGANPFDAGDFAIPYFSVIASAGDGTPDPDVIVRYVEVGYLN